MEVQYLLPLKSSGLTFGRKQSSITIRSQNRFVMVLIKLTALTRSFEGSNGV